MNTVAKFALLWLVAIGLGMGLDPWHERQFLPPAESRTKGEVLIDVFGEIKTVAARYLWFRMDLFHEVLDEQGVPTAEQFEVLPLLRMVTLLDSTMTDSYDQIVWDLYKGNGDLKLAAEILEEGIRLNPKSFQLNFRKAFLHHMEKQDEKCIRTAARSLVLTEEPVERSNSLRLMFWSAKRLGDVTLQKKIAADLIILRPRDPIWKREMARLQGLSPPPGPRGGSPATAPR